MPFVKQVKTNAYFSRFQVKWRRRREGKTDYRARIRMVVQDKNKYSTPRYRLVVRLTNHYVIAQIVHSEIDGDHVLAAAYSSELPRYGLNVGLKNYAAAYATGLLVARRVLTKLGLADTYKGNENIDGTIVKSDFTNDAGRTRTHWVSQVNAEKKPFRAVLDIGIRATTTGARIFGVMKGAVDGGLDIPHSEKRWPGYNRDSKEYKADVHKERIFGGHIASFADELKADDPESYQRKFSQYFKHGIDPTDLEELIETVHTAIRKNPAPAPKKAFTPNKKFAKATKITLDARKARVAAKKQARLQALVAAQADE